MSVSDANIPLLAAAAAFVVICLLATGVMTYMRHMSRRREMIRRVVTEESEWGATEAVSHSLGGGGKPTHPLAKLLHAIGLRTNPAKPADDSRLKLKFQRAGLRGRNVPFVFWGSKLILAASFPVGFLLVAAAFLRTSSPSHTLLCALSLAMAGLILPDLWLRTKTSGRVKRLLRGFPDALDLLVVCVEAGMGLDAGIQKVGEEVALSHPDLSEELKILNMELRAGKARTQALRGLADRTGIEDVKSLVTLLIQTDRFGTSVAQALRVYADSFRTARYQRAEEAAAKIATKLIFPLVLFIFPCMFVVLLGPVAIQVYRMMLQR